MIKFLTVIIIFCECLPVFSQNFPYSEDDWEIFTEPGMINAITETNWDIYIATENAVYKWNKLYQTMQYEASMTRYLDAKKIYHLYYDEYSDYFWAVHDEGISFRSSIATYWQDAAVSFPPQGITDIGSSDGLIWIDYSDSYIALDPYTGIVTEPDENFNTEFIRWGFSRFGRAGKNIDIDEYFFQNEQDYDSRYFQKNMLRERAVITMRDSDSRLWVGTNLGHIYMSENYSPFGNQIFMSAPDLDNITEIYDDELGNWWVTDNAFKRTGQKKRNRDRTPIYRWQKEENRWIEYTTQLSEKYKHFNINKLFRHGYYLFAGTMKGLGILNILENEWRFIIRGLNDPAIWDIEEKSGKLYLATARGINILSLKDNSLVTDTTDDFREFSNTEIYDIAIHRDSLFVVCKKGLYKYDTINKELYKLSDKIFNSIQVSDEYTLLSGDGIWQLDKNGVLNQIYFFDVFKMSLSGHFTWITDGDQAILLNLESGQTYYYNSADGIPGNRIFEIGCNDTQVWFGTDKGMAFYNWSKYHQ